MSPLLKRRSTPHDGASSDEKANPHGSVTIRAVALGAVLSVVVAGLQCFLSTVFGVHFFGGIQMPFGSIFTLMVLIGLNWPLRALVRRSTFFKSLPLAPTELLCVYSMLLFAALISTPGCDNFFLTEGAALFYFSSRENGWANLFRHVPSWFAPTIDGAHSQREVIESLYNGGVSPAQIPWHAWMPMLLAWGVFLALVYGLLFFTSLMLRRQWLVREALSFPLVQLPLQMVEVGSDEQPKARAFWSNRSMWLGFGVAAFVHLGKGMNSSNPDWPVFPVNQFGGVLLYISELPWKVAGSFSAELFLGAIGVAFLLTREVSFSFWFFFLLVKGEKVLAEIMGFAVAGMPRDTYAGQPVFVTFQAVGAWIGLGAILLWTAREHLAAIGRAAIWNNYLPDEPFSARFMVLGFLVCALGLLLWTSLAGINLIFAFAFFGVYLLASLVLARLVVEGGFLFPQLPFSPLEWMTTAMFGSVSLGAGNLTKLSFLQPMLLSDMRTNVLPGFLHVWKIGDELRLDHLNLRRLMGAVALAIAVTMATTFLVSLCALYSHGGLASYDWFAVNGPRLMWSSTAASIAKGSQFEAMRVLWMAIGATIVLLLTFARARLGWFPLHPLGFLVASNFPIEKLWFSFFVGWTCKSLVLRFGGQDVYRLVRPFMIGLILGNLCAMVWWMIVGFWTGTQITYWPA